MKTLKTILHLAVASVIVTIILAFVKQLASPWIHCTFVGFAYYIFVFYAYRIIFVEYSHTLKLWEKTLLEAKNSTSFETINKINKSFSVVTEAIGTFLYIIYYTVLGFAQNYQTYGLIDSSGVKINDYWNCVYFSIVDFRTFRLPSILIQSGVL